VLFAAGYGQKVSRGSQGWAILSLSPKGIRRGQGERGRESLYLPEMKRAQGKDWRKARFFLILFLVEEKEERRRSER